MPKKIAVYGGIVVVWVGGLVVSYKISEFIGNGYVNIATKATKRLLKLL